METRSRKQQERFVGIDKVFGLDLLREMILDYVIHDGKELVVPNVRSCRLVSKTWLNSTSSLLLKSKEPLFRFHLPEKRKHPEYGSVKHIRQFLRIGAKGQIVGQYIPPYAISVYCESSIYKPCQILLDSLTNCGGSLVELNFDFTCTTRPVPLRTNVQLPRLRTFSVYIERVWCAPDHEIKMEENMEFIQSVFGIAGQQINSFIFNAYEVEPDPRTSAVRSLRLPTSITELDLNYSLNDYMLEVVVKNDLPNLKILKFYAPQAPFKDGLITAVLQSVRKSLQNLCVQWADGGDDGGEAATTFQFPVMEKLQILTIETEHLELEECCSPLAQLVPSLSHVTFTNQSISSVRKWIETLCLDSVTSLTVDMSTEKFQRASLDLHTMKTVARAYPNLRELDMTLCGASLKSLVVIMTEMKTLQRLRISVEVQENVRRNSDFWDTLLTGLRKQEISRLMNSPELWEDFEANNSPSIRNLTDLHTLQLKTSGYSYSDRAYFPLVTDAVFHFAYFKMPNLKKLVLAGGFSAASTMAKQWRAEGRVIETENWRMPASVVLMRKQMELRRATPIT